MPAGEIFVTPEKADPSLIATVRVETTTPAALFSGRETTAGFSDAVLGVGVVAIGTGVMVMLMVVGEPLPGARTSTG
jgi:hypothetical protein